MAGQQRLFTNQDLLHWQSTALLREECRSLWRQRQQARARDDREGVRRWGRKRRQVLAELRRRRRQDDLARTLPGDHPAGTAGDKGAG